MSMSRVLGRGEGARRHSMDPEGDVADRSFQS